MKKIIKNPDGTLEELEGTPEEIAQLERERSRQSDSASEGVNPLPTSPGRRVLTDEVQRLIDKHGIKYVEQMVEMMKILDMCL